jgi:hypothetical protein
LLSREIPYPLCGQEFPTAYRASFAGGNIAVMGQSNWYIGLLIYEVRKQPVSASVNGMIASIVVKKVNTHPSREFDATKPR